MKTTSRFAVASAAGLFMGGIALTPAQAADLGGDCCADLEERVAELEATTVRKGNRVMSLKLSGHINKMVMWWDDGDETNIYVVDSGYSNTRFRFTGDANWRPGWKIGFVLEWDIADTQSNNAGTNATQDDGAENDFRNRQAHWWVKSDKLGKLSVGQLSSASDSTSEVNLSGATGASSSLVQSTGGSFLLVNNATQTTPTGNRTAGLSWGDLNPNDMDGLSRRDGVRYDSPTFSGFTLSTGWYEDDDWDVALRFAKQWNSVLFAAAVAYSESRNNNLPFCATLAGTIAANGGSTDVDCDQWNASASILHQPTGLFATIAGGAGQDDNRQAFAVQNGVAAGVSVDDDVSFFYANLGIYRRFNEWGKTSIGVEYYDGECGYGSCDETRATAANSAAAVALTGATAGSVIGGTDTQVWGAWIVQHIDNAATEFYLTYHHYEGDIDFINPNTGNAAAVQGSFEDWSAVTAGARVKF